MGAQRKAFSTSHVLFTFLQPLFIQAEETVTVVIIAGLITWHRLMSVDPAEPKLSKHLDQVYVLFKATIKRYLLTATLDVLMVACCNGETTFAKTALTLKITGNFQVSVEVLG